jgi:sterol desaturase/sphingolipid hydroxylase (fatty acid hydroxylase superfamily)
VIYALMFELALFAGFGLLSRVAPDRAGQPLLRADLVDDAIYFLGGTLMYGQVFAWITRHGADLGWAGAAIAAAHRRLQAGVSRLPLGLQLALLLLAYDFLQYWLHRWFHGRRLWRWHAVHHSPEEIDVMTSFRWHPVNLIPYVGLPTLFVALAGFAPGAVVLAGLINAVMSALTHANLSWTFGPFRYLVASPMFHRWHHARLGRNQSCNYAPNFPLWDLAFGTFHMPQGERPAAYGVPVVPRHMAQQLAYPFRRA